MKLMWFHLMPYTELPENFRGKHPSVWVDIHSSLFDPKRAHLMYNDFMDELEYAAEVGFDAVCVNEHHSNGYGLMPSPNLIASSLARRTSDTALCVMGNSLALYNPPTRVAEVRPRVSGIIVERLFHQGSEVKAGEPLYRIDPKPFQIEVQSNEAALAKTEAALRQATQQARRIGFLAKEHAAPEAEPAKPVAKRSPDRDHRGKREAGGVEQARSPEGHRRKGEEEKAEQ